ncbi:uncharacterized protein LOC129915707 isoform X3 [Episyrphus balteatus]|uniref:uncharacterized protein LOC129915707 isoform X3 n=1 Tax=Episyrphus balteatus TaxID=286459 RepID=UPI002485F9EF|nr:uncharacterized protein LOC129915707 isoform X3 [Episyrphus balteatus]
MCDMPIPFGAEFDPSGPGSFEIPNNNNNNLTKYELRAGRMYTNCDCSRRNGLQDACPHSTCQQKQSSNSLQQSQAQSYPSSYPLNFNSMPGLQNQGFENMNFENGLGPQQSGYSDYNLPINGGYQQNYPTDMPIQMPRSVEGFTNSNFMSTDPRNWGNGSYL